MGHKNSKGNPRELAAVRLSELFYSIEHLVGTVVADLARELLEDLETELTDAQKEAEDLRNELDSVENEAADAGRALEAATEPLQNLLEDTLSVATLDPHDPAWDLYFNLIARGA